MPKKDFSSDIANKLSAEELTKIKTALYDLLDVELTADHHVKLAADPTKNNLFQHLLGALRYSLHVLANSKKLMVMGERPVYDKRTNIGERIANHMKQGMWDQLCSYIGDIIPTDEKKSPFAHLNGLVISPVPKLELLMDNIAHGNLDPSKFLAYQKEQDSLHTICHNTGFTFPELKPLLQVSCTAEELVLLHATVKRCQQLQHEIKEREQTLKAIAVVKEKLASESRQSLLQKLLIELEEPVLVRKLAAIHSPNPREEILRRYNGKHLLPAALIGVDLPASRTYGGPEWINAAGLAFICADSPNHDFVGFAKPANSNRLKGKQFKLKTIGKYLQNTGGKPYFSLKAITNKVRFRSHRTSLTIKDESKLQVIKLYIFECKRNNLSLEINLTDKNKDYHLRQFSIFLAQYLTDNYKHLLKPGQEITDFYLYALIREKFTKLIMDGISKRIPSLLQLLTIAKKTDNHYAGHPLFSEVLFKPNFEIRKVHYAKSATDLAGIIREILTERGGDIGTVYVNTKYPDKNSDKYPDKEKYNAACIEDALTIGKALQAIYNISEQDIPYMELNEQTGEINFFSAEQLRAILKIAEFNVDEMDLRIAARLTTLEQPSAAPAKPSSVFSLTPSAPQPFPTATPIAMPKQAAPLATAMPKQLPIATVSGMPKQAFSPFGIMPTQLSSPAPTPLAKVDEWEKLLSSPNANFYALLFLVKTKSFITMNIDALRPALLDKFKVKVEAISIREFCTDNGATLMSYGLMKFKIGTAELRTIIPVIFKIFPEIPINISMRDLLYLNSDPDLWPIIKPYLQSYIVHLEGHPCLTDLTMLKDKVNYKKLAVIVDSNGSYFPSERLKPYLQGLTFLELCRSGVAQLKPSILEAIDVDELKIGSDHFPEQNNHGKYEKGINAMYDMISHSKFRLLDFTISSGENKKYYSLHHYVDGFLKILPSLHAEAFVLRMHMTSGMAKNGFGAIAFLCAQLKNNKDHRVVAIDLEDGFSVSAAKNDDLGPLLASLNSMQVPPTVILPIMSNLSNEVKIIQKLNKDQLAIFKRFVERGIIFLQCGKEVLHNCILPGEADFRDCMLTHCGHVAPSNEQLKTRWYERKAQVDANPDIIMANNASAVSQVTFRSGINEKFEQKELGKFSSAVQSTQSFFKSPVKPDVEMKETTPQKRDLSEVQSSQLPNAKKQKREENGLSQPAVTNAVSAPQAPPTSTNNFPLGM